MASSRYVQQEGSINLVSEVIIAISTSLFSGVLLVIFSNVDLQMILMLVLNLFLVLTLVLSLRSTNRLLYQVTSSQELFLGRTDPKDIQIDNLVRSLRTYGVIDSFEEERKARAILDAGKYLRVQNYLELLEKGFLKAEKSLYLVNDHPFPPCQEIVMRNLTSNVQFSLITGQPDNLYTKRDIDARITFLETRKDAEYYLLPPEELCLTLLVFDERFVLAYTRPPGWYVCNVTEAMLFTSPQSVHLFLQAFHRIRSKAKRYHRHTGQDTLAILQNFREYYLPSIGHGSSEMGPRSHDAAESGKASVTM